MHAVVSIWFRFGRVRSAFLVERVSGSPETNEPLPFLGNSVERTALTGTAYAECAVKQNHGRIRFHLQPITSHAVRFPIRRSGFVGNVSDPTKGLLSSLAVDDMASRRRRTLCRSGATGSGFARDRSDGCGARFTMFVVHRAAMARSGIASSNRTAANA